MSNATLLDTAGRAAGRGDTALYGRIRPLMGLIAAAFSAATALDQRRLPDARALDTLGLDAGRIAEIRFR